MIEKLKLRRGILFVLITVFSIQLLGCGKENADMIQMTAIQETTAVTQEEITTTQNTQETILYPITITDQIGREVVIEKPAERIVSSYYISSAIIIALGKAESLVGIEMKADTRELYHLAASHLIDLPAVGSGKGINIEETANLQPDLVILPKKLQDAVEQLEALNIPVLVVDPETIENYNVCVDLLGKAVGAQERAEELLSYYEEKKQEIASLLEGAETRPTIYLSSGSSFLSTCTSKMYQNDLIEMAGGISVSNSLTDGYWAEISKEQLLTWNPEYIFPVSYAQYSIEDIINDADLAELSAIKEKKVYLFPSAIEPWDYPTPSSILGLLWLTHTLHPDIYTKEVYINEAKEFYQHFFNIEVEEEALGL